MHNSFRTELWRIVKYILIGWGVNLVFTFIQAPVLSGLMEQSDSPGQALMLYSYGFILLNAAVSCLIHRYFTFRASEPWFVALPMMLLFTLGVQLLGSMVTVAAGRMGAETLVKVTYALNAVKWLLAYLFQRYVIYCHSTDEGGWYRRFHPANEEEGGYPYE